MSEPMFRDFDQVVVPQRKARIGGEEVDCTKIPSRVTLEMAKMADDTKQLGSEAGFYSAVELVAKACQPSNPSVTADFLLDNTDFETLMAFMEWVLEPVKRRVDAAEKNTAAQAGNKPSP